MHALYSLTDLNLFNHVKREEAKEAFIQRIDRRKKRIERRNIADRFRSFEIGFTDLTLGYEKISTEKENFDLKEIRKLKYSCCKRC